MVGVPSADGPDARAARRRGRPDRLARAGRTAIDEESQGKQTWRYRFPAQDYDLGRGEVCDPAKKQARPDDNPVQVGGRRRSSAVDPAARTVDLKRPVDEPHPRAIVPLNWVRTTAHQAALYDLGTWVADHGIQAPGPARAGSRPALPTAAAGRPVARRGAAPRPARPDLEAARRLAVVARPHDARDPGPTGLGQDLHRRPDDLLAAGRRQAGRDHRHEPQGHRQPADRGVLEAAAVEGVDVPARSRRATTDAGPRRRRA